LEKFEKNAKNVAKVFEFFKEMIINTGEIGKYWKYYDGWKKLYVKYWCGYLPAFQGKDLKKAETALKDAFNITEFIVLEKTDDYFRHARNLLYIRGKHGNIFAVFRGYQRPGAYNGLIHGLGLGREPDLVVFFYYPVAVNVFFDQPGDLMQRVPCPFALPDKVI
jgi:hypothetical protein